MVLRVGAHTPKATRSLACAWVLLMLLFCQAPPVLAAGEDASAIQGRQLYFSGRKDGADPLTANVGAAAVPVPATALPCAGCHGRDGQGRPEGGVRPSNITWLNLARDYGGVTQKGRRYDVYDEDSFLRAVSEGIDSAGNRLDSSMPRYNISRHDARDLIAYLKVIQDDFDPGVSEDAILVGTLQPSVSAQAAVGDAMAEVLRARFDEVNRGGGIYGKRLGLEVAPFEDRQSFIGQADKMIGSDRIFALISVFSSTADERLNEMAEESGMPSIGPYTQFPAVGDGQHVYTFYLHGGLGAQIGALARRAADKASGEPVLVLYRAGGGFAGFADDAVDRLRQRGLADVRTLAYPADGSRRLADLAGPGASVLFLGPSRDLVGLLGDAALGQAPPRLYLPGYFVGGDILQLPRVYAERLELAYINVPDTGGGAALAGFREFMARNGIEYSFLNARLYAYSASEILIEGLKRAGKRLTRRKLLEEIEKLYAFDAGLNRPLTFGSAHRVGMSGAYIVGLDSEQRRLVATDTWVGLD